MTIEERFWAKVDRSGDCWTWRGATSKPYGYGYFGFMGKVRKAHRVAWLLTKGEIPASQGYHGTCVLHRCDNPKCVNPDHLFLGSNDDNMKDMVAKRRSPRSHGSKNGNAKLAPEDVREIRDSQLPQAVLAERYGIDQTNVSAIKLGKTWAHL